MPTGTPSQRQPRLAVHIVICDQMRKLLPNPRYAECYAELFRRMFSAAAERAGVEVAFDDWDAVEHNLPPVHNDDAETRHLYVLSGSQSDAFGTDSWIEELRAFIRQAHACGCRFMGVCFGHQVIASALGGCVQRGPAGFWGAGARTITVKDPLVAGLACQDHLRLCVVHYDVVTKLPPCATLVATSDACTVESYRVGTQILTFQGHPEINQDFLSYYIDILCAHESPEAIAAAKATLQAPIDSQRIADTALRFFLQ